MMMNVCSGMTIAHGFRSYNNSKPLPPPPSFQTAYNKKSKENTISSSSLSSSSSSRDAALLVMSMSKLANKEIQANGFSALWDNNHNSEEQEQAKCHDNDTHHLCTTKHHVLSSTSAENNTIKVLHPIPNLFEDEDDDSMMTTMQPQQEVEKKHHDHNSLHNNHPRVVEQPHFHGSTLPITPPQQQLFSMPFFSNITVNAPSFSPLLLPSMITSNNNYYKDVSEQHVATTDHWTRPIRAVSIDDVETTQPSMFLSPPAVLMSPKMSLLSRSIVEPTSPRNSSNNSTYNLISPSESPISAPSKTKVTQASLSSATMMAPAGRGRMTTTAKLHHRVPLSSKAKKREHCQKKKQRQQRTLLPTPMSLTPLQAKTKSNKRSSKNNNVGKVGTTTTVPILVPIPVVNQFPKNTGSLSDNKKTVKKILRKKFSWKNYPELEAFLIANREEYLRHSALNYTVQQKQYNNRLTEKLLSLAADQGYVFDEADFSFVTVRDRIRCYFKSYVQSAKKRGVIIGYAARKAGLLTRDDLEKSAHTAGRIILPTIEH